MRSIRLRNSGRYVASSARLASRARSLNGVTVFFGEPDRGALSSRMFEPTLVVRIKIVFRKSTVSARGVRQPSVVEHLEKEIGDVRVALVELVEQDDRERVLSHVIGEKACRALSRIADELFEGVKSLYSLMSTRKSLSRLPNKNSAVAFASSVFPTPVGPTTKRFPRADSDHSGRSCRARANPTRR